VRRQDLLEHNEAYLAELVAEDGAGIRVRDLPIRLDKLLER
jgi:hypothetical protein